MAKRRSAGAAGRKPAQEDSFRAYVLEQLEAIPQVRAQRMFGGHGLYADMLFFGIIHRGRLFFRTSPASRVAYQEAGSEVFRPSARAVLKAYYEVPAAVLEQPREITQWAKEAIAAAAVMAGEMGA